MRLVFSFLPLFLIGCSTTAFKNLQVIQQEPPFKVITVVEPFEYGDGVLMIKHTWPKGDYTPVFETSMGFLYKAPTQIVSKDAGITRLHEGGLFIEKGKNIPTYGYWIAPGGGPLGLISSRLPIKVKIDSEIKVETKR